jgi:hypothetical protein
MAGKYIMRFAFSRPVNPPVRNNILRILAIGFAILIYSTICLESKQLQILA